MKTRQAFKIVKQTVEQNKPCPRGRLHRALVTVGGKYWGDMTLTIMAFAGLVKGYPK